jgi:3-hydroxyanthranilate 3,4-dioxygenase
MSKIPTKMPIVSLPETARQLGESGARVNVLWQHPESLVFMARGREYRSEFHINPSDEVMYPVKGDLKLHYRTEDGREEIAEVPEGSVIYTPAGTPHSPRFAPDAFLLVVERKRRDGEVDRFRWYCPKCDALLHEVQCVVSDYRDDPVSKAYRQFFDSEGARTCKRCGSLTPKPEAS